MISRLFTLNLSNMGNLDGNLFHTVLICERIRELDRIIDNLEMRYKRYPKSAMLRGTLYLTRQTHDFNVKLVKYLNPRYYEDTHSTLVRQ